MANDADTRSHLANVAAWAGQIGERLAPLIETSNGLVHFRPASSGVTMIGLTPDRPQRGKGGFSNIDRLVGQFDALFREHCVDIDQGRPTAEKRLQSFLISDAYLHDRRMHAINEPSARHGDTANLVFVTDEIPVPTDAGRVVCDVLAVREGDEGDVPVVIELKSERAMTRLIEQVSTYADLVDGHADAFGEIFAGLLQRPVRFAGRCEKWIVWPSAGQDRDPRESELRTQGIRVVEYEGAGESFTFRVGAAVERA